MTPSGRDQSQHINAALLFAEAQCVVLAKVEDLHIAVAEVRRVVVVREDEGQAGIRGAKQLEVAFIVEQA